MPRKNLPKVYSRGAVSAADRMKDSGYTVASMFAGIGGVDLGFEQAGAKTVWANEIDHFACETYRKNFPKVRLEEGDIYKLSIPKDIHIDILCAGFPCQAFSVAGYRKGFEDDRGVLFYQVMRIAEETGVRTIFCENVKNLKSHDHGNTYRVIRKLLEDAGYCVTEKVLNTCKYGNIPQNRERIYIVAFKRKADGSCPERDYFAFPTPTPLKTKLSDIVDYSGDVPDSLYYKPDHQYYEALNKAMDEDDTVYQWRRVYVRKNKSGMCPTLTANMGEGGHNVPIIRDQKGIRKLTPEECLRFQGFPKSFKFPEDMAQSHKYKQAGNSVSVPVIKRIAENVITAMKGADSE